MIGVVFDTNILVSANLNEAGLEALVLSLAMNHKIQMFVSEAILAEYEQVLRYPRLKYHASEVGRFMMFIRRVGIPVKPTVTVTESSDDADNRFLECAEAAGARFLVTGNKRHFPEHWKVTKIVNARELLGLIGSSFLQ